MSGSERIVAVALGAAVALAACGGPERARDASVAARGAEPAQHAEAVAAHRSPVAPATAAAFAAVPSATRPAGATPAHEPRAMVVPAGLRARTGNIEPSGIAWCAKLQRYLVVSDDTGLKSAGTRHAPWLFAMDAAGVLDAEPVPIQGLDRLNDPEAITPGPRGSFFIVTSHAPDHKGRTRPERRMLLHVDVVGRALRVLGRVDLTAARDRDGRGLLALAGLEESGRLDIEALAYREGALYVGLKSPLTARGGAVILRLAAPTAALQTGRIPAGALTRFAEVSLRVATPAGPVFQGLADMVFLPDGSLVLLGNAPKGLPADGGGAIWWLRAPGPGANTPALLHRFPGLRPEGVTLAADGGPLIVVFDRGQEPPWWSQWPLPR